MSNIEERQFKKKICVVDITNLPDNIQHTMESSGDATYVQAGHLTTTINGNIITVEGHRFIADVIVSGLYFKLKHGIKVAVKVGEISSEYVKAGIITPYLSVSFLVQVDERELGEIRVGDMITCKIIDWSLTLKNNKVFPSIYAEKV